MSKEHTIPAGNYSVTQIAEILGTTREAIHYRINVVKDIPAHKIGNQWIISIQEPLKITIKKP